MTSFNKVILVVKKWLRLKTSFIIGEKTIAL